jgi:hypothetical protein
MTTQLQTVEVYRPDCGLVLYSLEYAPVLNLSCIDPKREAIQFLNAETDVRLEWFPEGFIHKTEADGTRKVFWVPPEIADAVHYSRQDGATFKFKKDGSVEARCYGGNYYWGPPVEGAPEVCDQINKGHICDYTDKWSFNEGCRCVYCDDCYRPVEYCRCRLHHDCYCCFGSDDYSSE